jgi:uncharacterized RDD family membrane protein YckC
MGEFTNMISIFVIEFMDKIQIQTTQNVEIEYELASVGDRILASLLDYVFFAIYIIFLGFVGSATGGFYNSYTLIILLILPIFLYDLLCEIIFQGKSFGKMIMKIKVVKLDGTQATLPAYFLRWVLRIIDTVIFSPGVALLILVLNEKGQRLGDMSAGTTVVKLKQKVFLHDTILMQQQKKEYVPSFPQVTRLTDSDVAIIKEVMMMAWRTQNYDALNKLAMKTKEVMGVKTEMADMDFLNTVLQDYTNVSES